MMKYKSLWISFILIAAGLLAVYLIKKGPVVKEPEKYFSENIDYYCLENNCLTKKNNEWFLVSDGKENMAENDVADSMSGLIKKISLKNVASTNREKFSDFGLNDSSIYRLKVKDKQLRVGNVNRNYDGTFVMEDNGDKVYLIDQIIDRDIISTTDYWIRKKVNNWPRMQINKITIKHKDKKTTLNKVNDQWEQSSVADKVMQVAAVKQLHDFNPENSDSYEFNGGNGTDNNPNYQLTVGVKRAGRSSIFWASTDKAHYFEITPQDYALLTAVKF